MLAADAPPRRTPPKLDRRAALRAPEARRPASPRLSYRKMAKRSRSASRTLSTGVPCAHRAERAAGLGAHAAGGLLKRDANAVLEVARQPLPARGVHGTRTLTDPGSLVRKLRAFVEAPGSLDAGSRQPVAALGLGDLAGLRLSRG